jgi:dihydroorotate dehydrogenase electron transfer subunit
MRDIEGIVQSNQEVARDTFLLTLTCDLPSCLPGQFVMVKVNSGYEPFLRRPFAILGRYEHTLELLYKIKGQGTRLLSRIGPGEAVGVLGPLGTGFSMPGKNEDPVYIAGGTGLPPILSLAETIREGVLIFGAQTQIDIPLLSRIQAIGDIKLKVTTQDGSFGQQGIATDMLDTVVQEAQQPITIYACGPKGMLRAVSETAQRIGSRCEVSLEEYMSCGFGVCSGCVVETTNGNLRVCREGPVFDSSQLIWS